MQCTLHHSIAQQQQEEDAQPSGDGQPAGMFGGSGKYTHHHPTPADAEAAPAAPAGLTEEQLLEVFKQTSMFNVRTALQNNEVLLEDGEGGGYTDDDLSSDDGEAMTGTRPCMYFAFDYAQARKPAGFWSDEDGAAYAQHWRDVRRRDKGRRGGQRPATQRTRHVMHYNAASQAFIRRKARGEHDALAATHQPQLRR